MFDSDMVASLAFYLTGLERSMLDSDMVASLALYLNHRRLGARLQFAWTKRGAGSIRAS